MNADLEASLRAHRAGRLDVAERGYRALLEADPDCAEAWHLLGVVALQRGDPEAAEALLSKAVGLEPANAKFLNNYGVAAERRGDPALAAARFAEAVAADPAFADAQCNHGTALQALGRLDEAEAALRRAVGLDPDHARAHTNLGAVLKAKGARQDAIGHFETAAARDPSLIEPLQNLCVIYKEAGLVEKAAPLFTRALALHPGDGLRINRATLLPAIYRSRDHLDEARAAFEAGVERLLDSGARIGDPLREVGLAAFYLPYQGGDDRDLQVKLARLYAEACPELRFTASHAAARAAWQPGARLRIGFVSKYLRDHTIGKLNRGFVRKLDRDRFHVTTFALSAPDDEIAREIAAASDRHVVLPQDLWKAREIVAAAELDLLFYTDVGMEPFTYFLAFSRLAPVQCVTWGHPVTTGLDTMDYFVSNPDMDPPGAERHYSERLERLGRVTTHYSPPAPPRDATRDALGLPDKSRLYVCPQSLFKLHPDFDAMLAGILRRDSDGLVLLVDGPYAEWRAVLESRFETAMPDVAGRVRFLPRLSYERFLELIAVSDVMLDTTPFCGGNTTLEALAVGTPVVTLTGDFLRGRLSHAIYRQMELSDCIASTPDGYVELANALAMDPERRAAVVRNIEARHGALFEDPLIIRQLEDFFVRAVDETRGRMA